MPERLVRSDVGAYAYSRLTAVKRAWCPGLLESDRPIYLRKDSPPTDTFIYIVGLIVIIGAILSYFGFR